MPIEERTAILDALAVVDSVFEFDDSDDTAVGDHKTNTKRIS